jgi:hypothetical protein
MMQDINRTHKLGEKIVANPVKVNVVVADVELIETVLQHVQHVQHSSFSREIIVAVQPTSSRRVTVSQPEAAAGAFRHKIIQGL